MDERKFMFRISRYIKEVNDKKDRDEATIVFTEMMDYIVAGELILKEGTLNDWSVFKEILFGKLIKFKKYNGTFDSDKYLGILFPGKMIPGERTTLAFYNNINNMFIETCHELNFLDSIIENVLSKYTIDKNVLLSSVNNGVNDVKNDLLFVDGLYLVKNNETYELYEKITLATRTGGYVYDGFVTTVLMNRLGVYGQI